MSDNSNDLVDLQLFAITGFIIALILSFLLTYNEKLIKEQSKMLFNNKTAQEINAIRAGMIFIVAIIFLYINYTAYKTCDNAEKNDAFLNVESSILSIIIAVIGVYIAYKNYNKKINIVEIENL